MRQGTSTFVGVPCYLIREFAPNYARRRMRAGSVGSLDIQAGAALCVNGRKMHADIRDLGADMRDAMAAVLRHACALMRAYLRRTERRAGRTGTGRTWMAMPHRMISYLIQAHCMHVKWG